MTYSLAFSVLGMRNGSPAAGGDADYLLNRVTTLSPRRGCAETERDAYGMTGSLSHNCRYRI